MARNDAPSPVSQPTDSGHLRFGQRFVKNRLPLEVEYIAALNQSHDANRAEHEVVYPGDDGRVVLLDDDEDVVELLYRDGRRPAWIDISVLTVRRRRSVMHLLCRGRYLSDEKLLYYHSRGTHPFGIKSPDLPLRRREGRFWLPRHSKALAGVMRHAEI